jgi:ABC-type molybdate transport system substrate-binding protein
MHTTVQADQHQQGLPALARQIDNGAPADLFASADDAWADYLDARGRLVPKSRRSFLSNRLVVVAPASLEGVLSRGAEELERAGCWEEAVRVHQLLAARFEHATGDYSRLVACHASCA